MWGCDGGRPVDVNKIAISVLFVGLHYTVWYDRPVDEDKMAACVLDGFPNYPRTEGIGEDGVYRVAVGASLAAYMAAVRNLRAYFFRVLLVGCRWAVPLLMVISDTSLFYTICSAVFSALLGIWRRQTKTSRWHEVIVRLDETVALFSAKLLHGVEIHPEGGHPLAALVQVVRVVLDHLVDQGLHPGGLFEPLLGGTGRLGGRGCAMKTLDEVHEVPQGEDVDLHEPPHVVQALEGLVDPVLAEPLAQRGDPGLDRGEPRELDLV